MNQQPPYETDADASDWVVRLQDAGEAEWLAFDCWLEASPAHGPAYDRALALWHELDRQAPALKRILPAPRQQPRWPLVAGGALAAALALGWFLRSAGPVAPALEIHQTATGEHQTVILAEGSHIDLSGGSRLTVALSASERRVTLDGEAIFDVTPDAARPFIITAGDRQVRVVGTEFDVRHRDDQLSVTVRRGVVDVAPLDPAQRDQAVRLTPGNRIDHRIGSTITQASTVSADDVFAWRGGHLIYRDRPLSEVVADLNAQFGKPVSVSDRKTADLRFSGVLVLDDEESVVHRLTLLAPLWSTSSSGGIVVGAKDSAAH